MNDPLSIIGRIYSIPMNDPFSRQHVLMLLFHVVFKLVENDVLVAIEDDTLDAVVRRVSSDRYTRIREIIVLVALVAGIRENFIYLYTYQKKCFPAVRTVLAKMSQHFGMPLRDLIRWGQILVADAAIESPSGDVVSVIVSGLFRVHRHLERCLQS